ncbi:MAG: chorismate mutase [Bacteroides sp.]|nr:chorismate mutase [Bacteroides sp.]MCM1549449.1 chorismate mutase [Clostridium sp.]
MDLNQIRKEIDQVDQQIVELFQRRMELAGDVAASKRESGKAIYDRQREAEKLERLAALADSEFNRHSIEELFLQIMSISRRYQYSILGDRKEAVCREFTMVEALHIHPGTRVVYQGVEGAFSEQAMMEFFGDSVQGFHVEQFEHVLEALEAGEAEYGVLPIENSSAGFVSGVYHLLQKHDVTIVGGISLEVEQALLGMPGASLEDIQTVYSHPQGLLQTKDYLEAHGWRQISLANTAVSARKVRQDGDIRQAAVASVRAARLYGLEVLQPCINTQKGNKTRFLVISKKKEFAREADIISISFSLPHESGSLYNALGHFIFNGLNMTSIESEPLPDRQWEYRFFITFEGNLSDSSVQNAITGIRSESSDFKLLGNYSMRYGGELK